MATTTLVYADADLAHPGELTQPLAVDGSSYVEPVVLGVDVAGYESLDSAANAVQYAVLRLPPVDGLETAASTPTPVAAEYLPFGSAATAHNVPIPLVPGGILAGDVIEIVIGIQESTVLGAATASGYSLRHHGVSAAGSFKPELTKLWKYATTEDGDGSESVSVSVGGSAEAVAVCRVWRGCNQSNPYTGVPVYVPGNSNPDPGSITTAVDGAVVVVDGAANRTGAVPAANLPGWSSIGTSINGSSTRAMASWSKLQTSAGTLNPPATSWTPLDNAAVLTDAMAGAVSTEVQLAVVVSVTDDDPTAALSSGDVEISVANEIQTLTAYPGSGSRTLTWSGQTTGSIADTASASTISTALIALSNIGPGDVSVSGGPLNTAPVTIEFQGTLALTDVPQITVSGSNTVPVNEIQTIQSDRTGGTFVLDAGGDPTDALPAKASAAQAEAALEGLAEIGAGNVEVTGGPLPTALVVEFVGDLAGENVATLGVDDSGAIGGSGMSVTTTTAGVAGAGMVVETSVIGSAGEPFTLVGSFNIPRSGAYQPQSHMFELLYDDYQPGRAVTVAVADHDGNHSWTAILVVLGGTNPAGVVEAFAAEDAATAGTTATYGAVTPLSSGAKALYFLAKARAGSWYPSTPAGGSVPGGYQLLTQAVADAMTLDAFLSPPLAALSSGTPSPSSWTGTEAWATFGVALSPAVPSAAGPDLFAVLGDDSTDTWVEIATAAGAMFEIVELDLDAVPADAVLTGAAVEFAHACAVPNQLRVALVGIEADGTPHLAAEQQAGYSASSTVTTVTTNFWTRLADGSSLNDYPRLGIALISTARHPALTSHRVFWARALVRYEEGGPVVTNATGPTSAGSPITWDYSSAGGYAQTFYEVRVVQGAGQDPDDAEAPADPLSPTTGDLVYATGLVPGELVRSLVIDSAPLSRGACTVAVRAWSSITSSLQVASAWSTDDFDITGGPPATPDQAGNSVVYDALTGSVEVEVTAPASVTRAWLARSIDGGATWGLVEAGPFSVSASSTQVVEDVYCPGAELARYRVAFDAGPMTETSAPDTVGSGDVDTTPQHWILICPSDPSLSTVVEVAAEGSRDLVVSATARDQGGATVAVSPSLGRELDLTVRTRNRAQREAVMAAITSGRTLRVLSYLGESWLMRKPTGAELRMQRWRDPANERLRDAYEISFTLVEVTR